jgi:predicted dehydrogenase
MSGKRFRAAIVGLGQVGLLFDEEVERKASGEVWTHFTAFQKLPTLFDLVAAVEPDMQRHSAALRRQPGLRIYPTLSAMVANEQLDVVSVCTPDASHLEVVDGLIGHCRGIFLEKPIAALEQVQQAAATVKRVRDAGISVRVNYYKRQEPMVRLARRELGEGKIANVAVKYSGPFLAVGSHALNLMLQFLPSAKVYGALRHPHEEGDGYSGFFSDPGGAMGQLIYCGPRHTLNFALEILHDRGSLCIERNLARLRRYAYRPSERYSGYRELEFEQEVGAEAVAERFVEFLAEIADELSGGHRDHSDLEEALATQRMMLSMAQLAKSAGGRPS